MTDRNKIKPPVILCGMMGTGKSTIGKLLARKLQLPFYDLDSMIEEKAGKVIAEIFEHSGEETFRRIERELLTQFVQTCDGVLALGGGSLQNQHVTDHVKLYGWLVFIDTPANEITKRVLGKSKRPMIDSGNPEKISDKIELLLQKRIPLYSQAHITIQAGGKSTESVTNEIAKMLEMYAA